MSHAVVLVWLGAASAQAAHDADLESFARARAIALEEPATERVLDPAGHDDDVANRVEASLSEARTAEYADLGAAQHVLVDAEALLHAHADLPEAPWLLAEVLDAERRLVEKADPSAASDLSRRAWTLEGPRAAAFGQTEPATDSKPPPALNATTRIPLVGPIAGDDVYVNGALAAPPLAVAPGEHHVRVLRGGRLAWAGWVTAPDHGSFAVPVPVGAPCSNADFAGVTATNDDVRAPLVACPNWAAARPSARGIEVARCYGSACGTWLPWEAGWGNAFEGPAHPPWPRAPNHDWIFWTASSAVAVLATGLVLWRAGAFDGPPPPRETFTWHLGSP